MSRSTGGPRASVAWSACLVAVTAAAALSSCGGAGADGPAAAEQRPALTPPAGQRPPSPAALVADRQVLSATDRAAIARTLRHWLLTGNCAAMSDDFLVDQTGMDRGDRQRPCHAFRAGFVAPAISAADVVVTQVRGTPDHATAVVTDDFSGARATYALIPGRAGWVIDDWRV